MSDNVQIGLIQASHDVDGSEPVEVHKQAAIEKHEKLVREAAGKGAQIICLQEIFTVLISVPSRTRSGTRPLRKFRTDRLPSAFRKSRRSSVSSSFFLSMKEKGLQPITTQLLSLTQTARTLVNIENSTFLMSE